MQKGLQIKRDFRLLALADANFQLRKILIPALRNLHHIRLGLKIRNQELSSIAELIERLAAKKHLGFVLAGHHQQSADVLARLEKYG